MFLRQPALHLASACFQLRAATYICNASQAQIPQIYKHNAKSHTSTSSSIMTRPKRKRAALPNPSTDTPNNPTSASGSPNPHEDAPPTSHASGPTSLPSPSSPPSPTSNSSPSPASPPPSVKKARRPLPSITSFPPARLPLLTAKAERIYNQLATLYPNPPIPLQHDSPFQLLVAVMLSAQCTDAKVNAVTPGLFAVGPDAAAMAQLQATHIESIIRVLGLAPTKAKNIHRMSQLLVTQHGGRVPDSWEHLEALPGVGHKTASVVMSQAFGHPAFPVDTHIHRLATRWGLSSGKSVEQTEQDLKALLPEHTWRDVHLQMIYFGREHCPAQRHEAAACPICSWAAGGAKEGGGGQGRAKRGRLEATMVPEASPAPESESDQAAAVASLKDAADENASGTVSIGKGGVEVQEGPVGKGEASLVAELEYMRGSGQLVERGLEKQSAFGSFRAGRQMGRKSRRAA